VDFFKELIIVNKPIPIENTQSMLKYEQVRDNILSAGFFNMMTTMIYSQTQELAYCLFQEIQIMMTEKNIQIDTKSAKKFLLRLENLYKSMMISIDDAMKYLYTLVSQDKEFVQNCILVIKELLAHGLTLNGGLEGMNPEAMRLRNMIGAEMFRINTMPEDLVNWVPKNMMNLVKFLSFLLNLKQVETITQNKGSSKTYTFNENGNGDCSLVSSWVYVDDLCITLGIITGTECFNVANHDVIVVPQSPENSQKIEKIQNFGTKTRLAELIQQENISKTYVSAYKSTGFREDSQNATNMKSPKLRRDSSLKSHQRTPLAPISLNPKNELNKVQERMQKLALGQQKKKSVQRENSRRSMNVNLEIEDKENEFNYNMSMDERKDKRNSRVKDEMFGKNVVIDVMPSEDLLAKPRMSHDRRRSEQEKPVLRENSVTPAQGQRGQLLMREASQNQSPISRRDQSKNPLMSVTRLRKKSNRSISQNQKSANLSIRKARKYRAGQEELDKKSQREEKVYKKRSRREILQQRSVHEISQGSHFGVHTTGHIGFYKQASQCRSSLMNSSVNRHRRESSIHKIQNVIDSSLQTTQTHFDSQAPQQHHRSNSLVPRRSINSCKQALITSNGFSRNISKSPTQHNRSTHHIERTKKPKSKKRIKIKEQHSTNSSNARERRRNYTIHKPTNPNNHPHQTYHNSQISQTTESNQRSRSVNNLAKKPKELKLRSPSPYNMTLETSTNMTQPNQSQRVSSGPEISAKAAQD
jgi:hypothetical protein